MFLVEREPGNVAVYNSAAELTQAVRQGAIGPRARIFHRRSSQWLPITEHPAYRRARIEAEREPLPPLRRRHWTFLPGGPGAGGSTEQPAAEASNDASGAAEQATTSGREGPPAKPRRRWWPKSLSMAVARIRQRGPTEPR